MFTFGPKPVSSDLTDLDGEGSVTHFPQKFWQNGGWDVTWIEYEARALADLLISVDYSYHAVTFPAFKSQSHIGPLTGLSPALTETSEILSAAVFTAR